MKYLNPRNIKDPHRIGPGRSPSRDITAKLAKTTDRNKILKLAREKHQVTFKGYPIRLTSDLSSETMQARKEWEDILKVLREKQFQPRLLYPARLSFIWEKKINIFSDEQNLKEFANTRPVLQETQKKVLIQRN